jgi:hypothetical protein
MIVGERGKDFFVDESENLVSTLQNANEIEYSLKWLSLVD